MRQKDKEKEVKVVSAQTGNEVIIDVEALKTLGAVALAVIGVMGTVVVAAVAPNLISAIYKLYKLSGTQLTQKQVERKAKQSLYYLKRTGAIRIRRGVGEPFIELTSLGLRRRVQQSFDTLSISVPVRWDKKWWLVAADIPTKTHRLAADYFRQKLHDMHFKSLQRTLWFYPHNPIKELELVVREYGIERFVTVMEVSRLDKSDEALLKRHFGSLGIM